MSRTRRERMWRDCLIRRQWCVDELVLLGGVSRQLAREFSIDLVRAGVAARQGNTWHLLTHNVPLPVSDPERGRVKAEVPRTQAVLQSVHAQAHVLVSDIAEQFGLSAHRAGTLLGQLAKRGALKRLQRGVYSVVQEASHD